jgi:hypothetical protein
MPESMFMKLGMHVMAPEPISTAYVINPAYQSVYVVARQQLGKNVTTATNRIIAGHVVLYAVHVSKDSRRLVLPRSSCFFIWQ